jgi:hypothetical protein
MFVLTGIKLSTGDLLYDQTPILCSFPLTIPSDLVDYWKTS